MDDILGKNFGRLIVIHRSRARGSGYYTCKCECGKVKDIYKQSLLTGATKSCGCLQREIASKGFPCKHFHPAKKKALRAWRAMLERCFNPKSSNFHSYGGRGITVCHQWMIFDGFYKDMGDAPDKLQIERIDNDGDYEPGNCCWASRKIQMRNRRCTVKVMWEGENQALTKLCEERGINCQTAYSRLKAGWPIEKVLSTEHHEFFRENNPNQKKMLTFNGVTKPLIEWAEEYGLPKGALRFRLKTGWPVDLALTTPISKCNKLRKIRKSNG